MRMHEMHAGEAVDAAYAVLMLLLPPLRPGGRAASSSAATINLPIMQLRSRLHTAMAAATYVCQPSDEQLLVVG